MKNKLIYQSHHFGIETLNNKRYRRKALPYQSHHFGIETPAQISGIDNKGGYQSHHFGIETLRYRLHGQKLNNLSIAPFWN